MVCALVVVARVLLLAHRHTYAAFQVCGVFLGE